jgi:hypothetical protein
MRLNHGLFALMLASSALASASAMSGCAGSSLVYDPYYREYHPWDHEEDSYYRQWEFATNRDHMDFDRRAPTDQHAYWGWRQSSHLAGRSRR